MICDFCSDPEAVVFLDALGGVVLAVDETGTVTDIVDQPGGFAACASCAALVKTGDREALAQHAADRFRRDPVYRTIPRSSLLVAIRATHHNFWETRKDLKGEKA